MEEAAFAPNCYDNYYGIIPNITFPAGKTISDFPTAFNCNWN